jgi:periplasmic protein TonB
VVRALGDDVDSHVATRAAGTTLRDRHAADAGRVDGVSWLPHARANLPPGSVPITAERSRFTRDRPAAAPTAPATLSLLTHAACLLAFTLLLSSRMALPDLPGATNVALVFEPAPPATAPAAPPVVHDIVPPPTEPDREVAPASEPPPPQVTQPPPTPEPIPAVASDPIRLPPPAPLEVTQRAAKTAPPPRTVPSPHSAPAQTLAGPAPTPAPAEAHSTQVATADPLIPPRPVAGMETNRAPAYPEIALRRHETGRVMLRVSVSAHGRPLEVDVAQSSGYPILDSAALSAVRQWQFIPAMQAGTAVAAIAEVPVRFQIDN